jgi:CHAT domain-containing protein/tetratricopeptide (TPR) repeat protein
MLRFLSMGYSIFRQMSFGLLALVSVVVGLMHCGQTNVNQTVASKTDAPVSDASALQLRKKAQVFYEADQPDSAFAYARASAAQAEKNKDWHTWGEAQTYILAAAYGLQKYTETAAQFTELEQKALAQIPNDSTFWSDYYNYAGAFYYQIGNYEAALKYGLKEITFYEKTGNKANLALANNNVGAYYLERGDYDRALAYTLPALQLYSGLPDGDPTDLVWTYDNLSKIWFRKKDFTQVIAYSEKGLALLHKKCPNSFDHEANLNIIIANVNIELKQYEKALSYLFKAYHIQETHKTSEISYTLDNLGSIYTTLGQFEKADRFLKQALSGFNPQNPFYADICRHIGQLRQKQGKLREALDWQQKSLQVLSDTTLAAATNPSLNRVSAYRDLLYVLQEKALTLRLLSKQESNPLLLEKALETFDLATNVLDSIRATYQEGSKQFWNREARPILENAIETALELHQKHADQRYLYQAFHYAEKGKAYLLAEALRESAAKQQAGIPESLLAEEKQMKIDIAFYKKQIFQEQQQNRPDASRILIWQSEILQRNRNYDRLLVKFEQEYPEYYHIKYKQNVLDVADVQRALPANTGLLEYFKGDSATFAFYIDHNTLNVVRCGNDSLFSELRSTLSNRDLVVERGRSAAAISDFSKQACSLYDALIRPVTSILPTDLILIPDGQLAYLPFELLLTEAPADSASLSYSNLPYLIRKTTVQYAYSADLAFQKNETDKPAQFFQGYAPSYANQVSPEQFRGGQTDCRDWNLRDFADLPGNRAEVKAVAELEGGKAVLEQAATESYFRQHARESRILHLAMHGFVNECDPAYSGLVFSAPAQSAANQPASEENDGMLHAYELYNLHLNAELAVLSACNTGSGHLAQGEGVMSLARAFKYAGCANVLMSLWQVDDAATSDIMQKFYGYLNKGYGKAAAVRQAKLDYLAEASRNHPFYWGAFVLIGDDLPLQKNGLWIFYVCAAILVLCLAVLLRKRSFSQLKSNFYAKNQNNG